MVQISFEYNKIRLREMKEKVRGFSVKIPISVARAPEGVLLVNPFTLPLVLLRVSPLILRSASIEVDADAYLPSLTHALQ